MVVRSGPVLAATQEDHDIGDVDSPTTTTAVVPAPTTRRRPRKRPPRSCRLVVDGIDEAEIAQGDTPASLATKKTKWDDGDGEMEFEGMEASATDLPESANANSVSVSSPVPQQSPRSIDQAEAEIKEAVSPKTLLEPEVNIEEEEEEMSAPTRPVESPLDFSVKKSDDEESPVKQSSRASPDANGGGDSPLDLSCTKKFSTPISTPTAKSVTPIGRIDSSFSPWTYAPPKAPPLRSDIWNGKSKRERTTSSSSNESSLNISPVQNRSFSETKTKPENFRPTNRQNPWQSQWISRSGEQTKDVFTCVWCKESFQSLADMTIHMKHSPRCGMAGMHAAAASTVLAPTSNSIAAPIPQTVPSIPTSMAHHTKSSSGANHNTTTTKDGVPLPRKLVRGQDVWLGKGAEQTRQILKCMWCGQSFKSLADMTTHMRVTQHYTNIISQEQIISWRTPEDKLNNQSQVNAVLTCKVCDQAFGSLKELSYHMVKNSHYKEHILRSITDTGASTASGPAPRRRQTRERRKKSLPVRKLLELERMEMTTPSGSDPHSRSSLDNNRTSTTPVDGRILCDECHEKMDAKDYVNHLKHCSRSLRNHTEDEDDGEPRPRSTHSADTGRSASADSNVDKPTAGASHEASTTATNTGGSVLNALEKLVEKSFDAKGKRGVQAQTGILQRLGIDEEVYPPWHPAGSPRFGGAPSSALALASILKATAAAGHSPMASNLSSRSLTSPCPSVGDPPSSSFDHYPSRGSTPNRPHLSRSSSPDRHSHRSATSPPSQSVNQADRSLISPAPSETSTRASCSPGVEQQLVISDGPNDLRVSTRTRSCSPGAEADVDDNMSSSSADEVRKASPVNLQTMKKNRNNKDHLISQDLPSNLVASHNNNNNNESDVRKRNKQIKKGSDAKGDNPLKELQKLLDKTDTHHLPRPNSQMNVAGMGSAAASPYLSTTPGSILAFSWACSEAATSSSSSDPSMIKCAFCDNHFVSKGSYRHHLSKMHFIKDTDHGGAESPKPRSGNMESSTPTPPPQTSSTPEESPHSKFLKYAELAKQLSSKYV